MQNKRSDVLGVSCFAIALVLCAPVSTLGQNLPKAAQGSPMERHHLVFLLDTNPDQKKVLDVELAIAEGVMGKLNQRENVFSVFTFGYDPPVLVKSEVQVGEAISALRTLKTEAPRKDSFSVPLYGAVHLALDEFDDGMDRKSILVISEGNSYFPGETFKETVSRAQQLQVNVDVAMVADHTLYGTKGIQRYGFDLRRLAGKTRGQYVEVGGVQKKVSQAVTRLADAILREKM